MKKDYRIALVLAVCLIFLDQLSKWIINQMIPFSQTAIERITVIPGFMYITNHRNTGAAWGVLSGQLFFFIVITLFALVVFLALARELDFRKRWFFSIGITLLLAGAIGNFIDRLRWGYVVDFLDFYPFGYNFPIFNVADMCLTVGMIAFAVDMLIIEPRGKINDEEDV